MSVTGCISDEALPAFLEGILSDDESLSCEEHLQTCARCLERTRNLQAAQTVANALRGESGIPSEEEIPHSDIDSELAALIRQFSDREHMEAVAAETVAEHLVITPVDTPTVATSNNADTDAPPLPTAPSVPPAELGVGSRLGPYRILAKLGQGGMGAVYQARHSRLDKVVAIKILSAQVTQQADAVIRFEREMRAVGKLSHPHIVQAFDAGEIDGTHYLAMEYVEGVDLQQLVKDRGPLPVSDACQAIRQAALALAAAHGAGLVHRDIKPSNLLMDKDGQVKLLDLGLALLSEDTGAAVELTTSGQAFGTPDYMAPEQWEDAHTADARTDLYALGCTLYHLLVGRPPYATERYRTAVGKMKGHVNDPIPDLQAERKNVPVEVVAIYTRLMAKLPAERFQTAAELVGVLAPFVTSKSVMGMVAAPEMPTLIIPPSVSRPLPSDAAKQRVRWAASRIALTAGGGVALLCAVIAIIIATRGDTKAKIDVSSAANPPGNSSPDVNVEITEPDHSTPVENTWHGWPATAPKPAIAPFDSEQARQHQAAWAAYLKTPAEYTNSIGMKLRLITPGEFLMGSSAEQSQAGLVWINKANLSPDAFERSRIKEEGPQHAVTITKPFCLAATEVTAGQFRSFVEATKYLTQAERFGGGDTNSWSPKPNVKPDQVTVMWRTPGFPTTDDHPVTQVTWADAVAFCNWLSVREGLSPCYEEEGNEVWQRIPRGTGYRLPTEAEWEYACRAGTNTHFSFGNDPAQLADHGWSGLPRPGHPHPVAQKTPNSFGLFDMHGNVREWCHDWYSSEFYAESIQVDPAGPDYGSDRVMRSGRASDKAVGCRSAFRYDIAPFLRTAQGGFRVVRSQPPTATDLLLSAQYEWSVPENLDPKINSVRDDASPFLSADGLSLLFASKRPYGHVGFELWESRRTTTDEPFGPPREMPRIVNSIGDDDAPCLSVDGRELVFASNRPGSVGNRDLYVCRRSDLTAKWDAPVSLGAEINTTANEDNPVLADIGLTLYFSSNRPGGHGGMDIWRARRPSTTAPFGTPTNLGPIVNTPQDEIKFAPLKDGRSAVLLRVSGNQSTLWAVRINPGNGEFHSPQAMELGEIIADIRGPQVSPDGMSLYFHAVRPDGVGAADLWKIRRVPKLPMSGNPTRGQEMSQKAPEDATPDRIAAEWVIGLGGYVQLQGSANQISDLKLLPARGFKLTHVQLTKKPLPGENQEIVPLRGLEQVEFVGLDGAHVSLAGVESLEQLPKLSQLSLGGGKEFRMTEAHLAAFTRLKALNKLYIAGTYLTPAHCAILSETLPNLESLNLQNNKALDDTVVQPLGKLAKLKNLQLQRTSVTAEGVAALKKLLPNCIIQSDHPDVVK